jgi:hypothetical protein
MDQYDRTRSAFERGRPAGPVPPSAVDIKAVMRHGYRAEARRRAAIGGAVVAGVAALATVLTLSLNTFDPEPDTPPADDAPSFDPTTAGYPDLTEFTEPDAAGIALNEASREVFGPLAVEFGFLDEEDLDETPPSEDEVISVMEADGVDYYEALSILDYYGEPLQFLPESWPAAGGQAYLRGYFASSGSGGNDDAQLDFGITALQPGGWTPTAGPTGDVAFPQHLLNDEADWTDEAPVITTEELDDGRILMTADHGCALDVAVAYPNGSALRSHWNLDCQGQGREMSLEDLVDAMLLMPEIDYDTSRLAPVQPPE